MACEKTRDALARQDAMTNERGSLNQKTERQKFSAGSQAEAELLRQFIYPGAIVLGLGRGLGHIKESLAPYCGELYIADVLQKTPSLAAERLRGLDNVYLQKLDGHSLQPFSDHMFDFVCSVCVLQHMEKEDAFFHLREVYRVLKPNGRVLLQFPNIRSEFYFEQSFLVYVDTNDRSPARVRLYCTIEVERFMHAAGFVELDIREGLSSLFSPHEISVLARKPVTGQEDRREELTQSRTSSEDVVEITDSQIDVETIMSQIRASIAERQHADLGQVMTIDNNEPIFVQLYLSNQGSIAHSGFLARLRKKAHELVLFYVNRLAGKVDRFRSQVVCAIGGLAERVERCASREQVAVLQDMVQRLSMRVMELETRAKSVSREAGQESER